MKFYATLILVFLSILFVSCKKDKVDPALYESSTLIIKQVSPNTYVHISYLHTDDFGTVACNGMVVLRQNEALVFDTPTDSLATKELITWIEQEKKAVINGVIVTHFHEDCLGGLAIFHQHSIPSFANELTAQLALKANYTLPQHLFKKRLDLQLGDAAVINQYFGEGHTADNIVSYFPLNKVLFGGCLVKENGASKGFLGDATIDQWSKTVATIRTHFPEITYVIPGHGAIGNQELLTYTEALFKQ